MYASNAIVDEIESTILQTTKKNNILVMNSHSTTSACNLKEPIMLISNLASAYASSSTEATKLQTSKKKLSDLALNCLGLNIVDKQENKSKDDNNMQIMKSLI
ncbi:4052_t:CDS:2 [Cetraspora pellucida]|uniref:4052_t:CDS:1 n=1 Tax=Cetraspora pellucida TaxID=1433469 RepID=A0ACA9KK48_9GLOM|nr:4052_t:CDS:2 [Cetraspora pellucida]